MSKEVQRKRTEKDKEAARKNEKMRAKEKDKTEFIGLVYK